MSGLLERALFFLNPSQRNHAGEKTGGSATPGAESDGVTGDERRQLVAEINQLFTSRPSLEDFGKSAYTARHSGIALPILVNLISVAVLLIGLFGFRYLLASINVTGADSGGSVSTTEGLVVKEVQRQASAALSERDARIAAIKRELEQLSSTRPQTGSADLSQIQAREQQLTRELNALQSDASARLDNLAAQQSQDAFLLRQLRSSYEGIRSAIAADNLTGALADLTGADLLLQRSEQAASTHLAELVPAMQSSNATIRTALSTIQSVTAAADAASAIASRSAEIDGLKGQVTALERTITDLRSTIADQNARVAKAESDAAARDRALREQAAREAVLPQTAARQAAQIAQLERDKAALNEQLTRQSSQIADQSAQIGRLQTELSDRKAELDLRTQQLSQLVAAVQRGLRALRDNAGSASSGKPEVAGASEVLDLLNTKVKIRQIAELSAAKELFPDLSAELSAFFDRYGAYFVYQGRSAALGQIDTTLKSLDAEFAATVGGLKLPN